MYILRSHMISIKNLNYFLYFLEKEKIIITLLNNNNKE